MMKSKFDIFTKVRKYISPTQMNMVLNCPCAFKYRYEDKVKMEPCRAVELGRIFDQMIEYGAVGFNVPMPLPEYSGELLMQRYKDYFPHIPKDVATQHPFEFELGYHDYWVRGFIDILPDNSDNPFREVKLATRPWERRKIAYNRVQIITYSRALDFRPGQFDVSNMDEPGIQFFGERDYLPKGKTPRQLWEMTEKSYIKAIKMIESSNREPTPNILCKGENKHGDTWQCDYYELCQGEIRAKEARINDLSRCF